MRTNILLKGMAVLAAVFALAGCQKEGAQTDPVREIDWSRARFVVDATAEDGAQTRALKTEWKDGDEILVFFGGTRERFLMLEYDEAAQEWTRNSTIANLDGLDPDGHDAVSAIHSSVGIDSDIDNLSVGTDGDLLYTDAGSYTADVSDPDLPVVHLTLALHRAATTAVIMRTPADEQNIDRWRLWGDGLSKQTGATLLAEGAAFTSFDEHVRAMFTPISSTNWTLPDAAYLPDGKVVFHVMSTLGADAPVTFNVFKDENINGTVDPEETVYTRTFTGRELTAGATVEFDGPTLPDAIAPDKWQEAGDTPTGGTIIPAPLTGLDAPATGAAPDMDADATDGYEIGIEWIDVTNGEIFTGSVFANKTEYEATITLTAKTGWQFSIAPATSDKYAAWNWYLDDFAPSNGTWRMGNINYDEVVLTSVEFNVLFPVTALPTVPAAPITGITTPVRGATPSMAIDNDTGYTAEIEWWDDGADIFWRETDNFRGGRVYTVQVELAAAEGYTFEGFTDDASVQGFKPADAESIERVSSAGSNLRLLITYPKTELVGTPVTAAPLTIGTPTPGEAVSSITVSEDSDLFSASILRWTKDPVFSPVTEATFQSETRYEVSIELTAAEGYTFEGFTDADVQGFKPDNADRVTYNGLKDGILTIGIRFPMTVTTGATQVTLPAVINGITSPVTGAAYDMTADDDNEYFEVTAIRWRRDGGADDEDDTFAAGKDYIALITLKPKAGYTFSGLNLLEQFTVNGIKNRSSSGVQSGGTVDIVVDFPTTAADGE